MTSSEENEEKQHEPSWAETSATQAQAQETECDQAPPEEEVRNPPIEQKEEKHQFVFTTTDFVLPTSTSNPFADLSGPPPVVSTTFQENGVDPGPKEDRDDGNIIPCGDEQNEPYRFDTYLACWEERDERAGKKGKQDTELESTRMLREYMQKTAATSASAFGEPKATQEQQQPAVAAGK